MRALKSLCIFAVIFCFLFYGSKLLAQPKGAKAIFDSGEGPAAVSSVTKKPAETAVAKEKYVGIAYQIMLLAPDGSFKPVTKARTFRSGEKVKLIVRTNRSGYLTIMNIGPTGNTHILFDEYVEAFTFTEIPKNTNLVFAGTPGTEKLIIMLSDNPNPITNKQNITVEATPTPSTGGYAGGPQPPSPSTGSYGSTLPPPPPTGGDAGSPPPPSGYDIANALASAKSIKGAKDIVVEDNLNSSYTVISPKTGYKPVKSGMKDIVLESSAGVNYGVVPVSSVANGGILTLQINLKHK